MKGLLPDNLKPVAQKTVWIWTTALTLLVILWFALTTDAASIAEAFARVGAGTLFLLIALMMANSLLLALWLGLICKRESVLDGASLRVTGWYLLSMVVLPVRLGDVAWIYLMHKWLGLPAGRAIFIGLYHRLADFVVTSLFFLLAGVIVGTKYFGEGFWLAAVILFIGFFLLVLALEFFLTIGARVFMHTHERTGWAFVQGVGRQILQIRLWYRHHLTKRMLALTFLIIFARWALIIVGIAAVILAAFETLSWADGLLLTNAYIYVSVIPLQAFGGIGIGEASLAGMLTVYGVPLAMASAVSLLIRLTINAALLAFWAVAGLLGRGGRNVRREASHS